MLAIWIFFDYGGFWGFESLVFVLISDFLGRSGFGDFVVATSWFAFAVGVDMI